MALVDTSTGEIVVPLTADEASVLTAKIKGYVTQAWSMLAEAHDRLAHIALGYSTWEEYVHAEFDLSRSRSYQILDQATVIRAIESVSTSVDTETVAEVVTEAVARDIKPRLTEVTKAIKERVTAEAEVEPQRVKEIVAEVVAEEREKAQQQAEDRKAIADLTVQGRAGGMDLDEASQAERGGFSRLCMDLSKLAPPAEFLERHRTYLTPRHIAQAERAYAWLDEFLTAMKEGE